MRFIFWVLTSLTITLDSCTPTVNQLKPPENYKGELAEPPIIGQGDYWIYQRANLTRLKTTKPFSGLHFPLWVGKTWRYDVNARRANQPPTSPGTIPAWQDCYITTFTEVSVPAGSFGAFQCECECHVVGGEGIYQEGCGISTFWYAPQVKNIVKIKTQSTATSLELMQYRASGSDSR